MRPVLRLAAVAEAIRGPFRHSLPRPAQSAHRETHGSTRSAQRLCVRLGSNTLSTARGRGLSRSAGSWPRNDIRARRHSASRWCFADAVTGERRLLGTDRPQPPGMPGRSLRIVIEIDIFLARSSQALELPSLQVRRLHLPSSCIRALSAAEQASSRPATAKSRLWIIESSYFRSSTTVSQGLVMAGSVGCCQIAPCLRGCL